MVGRLHLPSAVYVTLWPLLAAAAALGAAPGQNWPSYGGDGSEHHYSPLTQISAANISRLGLAWYHDIDVRPNAYSAPLAVNGVLYMGVGYSVLQALDARSGRLLWSYDPHAAEVAGHKLRAAWGIRGIAYADGRIFSGTIDGRLIAVDAHSGKLLWSEMTVDANDGRYITGPPWVYNGKVVIGHGGGDFAPVRGYVTAYDARSGRRLWRFHTVPGSPAQGKQDTTMTMAARSWSTDRWQSIGGGTVWGAMAYDAQYNRLYIGTGNGAPWNQRIRSPGGGDNLFLASIIALNADTGEYLWHYQLNPGDTWDYDAAVDIELAEFNINGRKHAVIMQAAKNGFFYVIDRDNGKLLSAEKYVAGVNWAERIDLATGRPVENPTARFSDGQVVVINPSAVGAHSAEAMSYNLRTGLAYIPAIVQAGVYSDPKGELRDWQFTPGQVINNGIGAPPRTIVPPPWSNTLLAWDPQQQRAVWSVPLPGMKNGGTMTTAGNLVFQGTVQGELVAYAADTGRRLWAFDAQNGVMAQPITYSVGGRQYLTVISGWRMSTAPGPGLEWDYVTQRRRVLTFALDAHATLPAADRSARPFVEDATFVVDESKAARGAAIYGTRCAVCHGGGLRAGGSAPDLRKAAAPLSADAFYAVLHDGLLVHNGMPRFEELETAEIEGLQHYIRQQARHAANMAIMGAAH